jgi:riboflavin synthase
VVDVDATGFTVALIPHTMQVTRAGRWQPGTAVNLEADLVAKYVEKSLAAHLAGTPQGPGPNPE